MKLSDHNFINGEWVRASDAAPNINPSDVNDIIGDFPLAGVTETEAAIEAAILAQQKWRALSR